MSSNLFTDILGDEINDSQPISLVSNDSDCTVVLNHEEANIDTVLRPAKRTGQYGEFRSVEEIDSKYRNVFAYPYFNLVQSRVIDDAVYSDKSMVVCAPTGSGKTVIFEMAIVQLLMEIEDRQWKEDFKIIYMAPVKALCTERLTEWYSKFTKLGLLCIEVTGDTDVDFSQLKPYRIIITTPEKWDMLTRRWRDHRSLVEVIKLFLIDEVHILNDETRGPVLEAVVSRMKTIESSAQSAYRIEQLQKQYQGDNEAPRTHPPPSIRFVAVSATISNPEDVAAWLGTSEKPAVYYKFGDECRPVKLKRVVEGYPCSDGTSIFKFDIILNYKLWPVIQKYHNGKPTLIFCNTRKSVILTAETLSRELTINFNPEQKAKLSALASTIKNKKLQALVLSGVGCHHAGMLYEERLNIEQAFRNRDLPILITTTTLAMGVNLPAHLVIIKNTQQYVNGAYQEYSISTVLQMVGRAGRPQFDTEATAVIMTRLQDKQRYQALVGGNEPLQSFLHKRLPENLNSEAALGTVTDVAQCVQWLHSTFLYVRAAKDPKRYLALPPAAPSHQISKKIEELCVKAMNGLASAGLITMDEASCIESTEAGRLMSIFYLDLETMKQIMKIEGNETLEKLLWIVCESHELADMHLRVDERRCLNALNRNNAAATIRFPMKGKISTRQMKLNCIIQAVLGCLPIPDPSLNQEAMKIMRIADRVCKCLVAYVTRREKVIGQPQHFSAVLNSLILAKCIAAHLWENSPFVSKQLKGIGPTFSTLLATAGKINFMLLEESHPRDLERIMNKGPPAGNALRKQISLLPKYQLTMNPIDKNIMSVQLVLLNHSYLLENISQLTAGDNHKCYIVVGDSENHLLLFSCFKDSDLINVYDGTITHQVTRKHSFQHKIFAHCISSNFAGIDAQSHYTFESLDPPFPHDVAFDYGHTPQIVNPTPRTKKQTNITDTFRERKKRPNTEIDIAQSKEKKKRDNAIIKHFESLKKSFDQTEIKEDLQRSAQNSNKLLYDLTCSYKPTIESHGMNKTNIEKLNITNPNNSGIQILEDNVIEKHNINFDANSGYDFADDEKINDILSEIENEISKSKTLISNDQRKNNTSAYKGNANSTLKNVNYSTVYGKNIQLGVTKKQKLTSNVNNYNSIDLLERNSAINEEEDTPTTETGFSSAIKSQIEKYLQNVQNRTRPTNTVQYLLGEINQDCIEIKSLKETIEHQFDKDNKEKSKPEENYNIGEAPQKDNNLEMKVISPVTEIDLAAFENNEKCDVEINIEHKYENSEKALQDLDTIEIEDYIEPCQDRFHDNTKAGTILIEKSVADKNETFHKSQIESTHYENILDLVPYGTFDNDIINVNDMSHRNNKLETYLPFTSAISNSSDDILLNMLSDEAEKSLKINHTNKYSYSATKIDVSTTPNQTRVIRKIKMDVDITEIITKEDREEKAKSRNNNEIEMQFQKDLREEHYGIVEAYDQLNNSQDNTLLCYAVTDQTQNVIAITDTVTNSDQNQTDEFTYSYDKETAPIINEPSINERNYDFKNEDSTAEKNKVSIGDILQKYSKSLRKNTEITPKLDFGLKTEIKNRNNISECNFSEKTKKKPARPYKISDIENLKMELPSELIPEVIKSSTTPTTENTYNQVAHRRDSQEEIFKNFGGIDEIEKTPIVTPRELIPKVPKSNTRPTKPNACDQVVHCRRNKKNALEDLYGDIQRIEVTQKSPTKEVAHTLDDYSIDEKKDYEIDNSMFNPKLLLQSLSKDSEDIIPPPPQFSDTCLYSPTPHSSSYNIIDNDHKINSDFQDAFMRDIHEHETNIFDDTNITDDIDLTPTKEIETWVLTPETNWPHNEPSPVKSFTILHKNSPRIITPPIKPTFNSQKRKLERFKFNRKNKFKIRP